MKKKYFHYLVLILIIPYDSVIAKEGSDSSDVKYKEISVGYTLQCPVYSVNTPLDLGLSQDMVYRSRISAGLKYYLTNKWHIDYAASFSQEGGGFKQQRTNANYLKNTICLGYSTRHSRRIVFSLFGGIDANMLINAHNINDYTKEREDISDFFYRLNLNYTAGLGFKTRIVRDLYFNFKTFISISPYNISRESYIKVSQVIFPAFQFSISKFLGDKQP